MKADLTLSGPTDSSEKSNSKLYTLPGPSKKTAFLRFLVMTISLYIYIYIYNLYIYIYPYKGRLFGVKVNCRHGLGFRV